MPSVIIDSIPQLSKQLRDLLEGNNLYLECALLQSFLHSKSLVFYTQPHVPSLRGTREVPNQFLNSIVMLLLGTASGPAVTRSNQLTDQKRRNCEAVVGQVFALLEAKTHTRQIMTNKVSSGDRLIPRQNCPARKRKNLA